jgi:hypothetical protein
MTEYDNTNRGALFKTVPDSEKHPTCTGTLNVDGVDYDIAGWHKRAKSGKEYIALTVKPKGATRVTPNKRPVSPAPEAVEMDDEIPF